MTEAEAIAVYNEMAEKYNAVMDLYDLCDCNVTALHCNLPRIPLYDPASTKSHGNLLTIQDRNGIYLVSLIMAKCKALEDISLKLHGPDDAYHKNGYVQLYSATYTDPVTGLLTDDKNGTTVDYVDNECADLDTLTPVPDSSEFLETKVYPIISTKDKSNIDNVASNALDVFNAVAALPKECSLIYDSYEIGIELQYTHANYTRSDYETALSTIYSTLAGYISTDYDNWVAGNARTLATDLSSLMAQYTNATDPTIEELLIQELGTYSSFSAGWYLYDPPISGGAFYFKPGIRYEMQIVNGTAICKYAQIGPIKFKTIRYRNPYSSTVSFSGYSYNWAVGSVDLQPQLYGFQEHNFDLTTLAYGRTYNKLRHLTAVNNDSFSTTINPCSPYILGGSNKTAISSFPGISASFEYYLEIANPTAGGTDSAWVYQDSGSQQPTVYHSYDLTFTPECHQIVLSADPYLQLPEPEPEE